MKTKCENIPCEAMASRHRFGGKRLHKPMAPRHPFSVSPPCEAMAPGHRFGQNTLVKMHHTWRNPNVNTVYNNVSGVFFK